MVLSVDTCSFPTLTILGLPQYVVVMVVVVTVVIEMKSEGID